MKIIECLHTQNRSFGEKRQDASPVGIVVHSTGANNPNIKRYCQPSDNDVSRDELLSVIGVNKYNNHWNKNSSGKSVHYFIGKLASGSVATVRCLPESISCWGCGKGKNGSYNYDPTSHIQFEICEDSLKDKAYFEGCYKEATELCADICRRYGWDPSVIVSHKEAHTLKYASNHKDIDHWLKNFGLTMDDFRNTVAELLNDNAAADVLYTVQVGAYSKKENAEKMRNSLVKEGFPAIIKKI